VKGENMGYYSDVAAAIGGNKEAIKQFSETVKSARLTDEANILKDFRVYDMKDLSLFIFQDASCKWYDEADTTWDELIALAETSHLSWIFYRVGEDYTDVEIKSNYDLRLISSGFSAKMAKLFSIERCIKSMCSELDALLQ
jgi:hypothetical protein